MKHVIAKSRVSRTFHLVPMFFVTRVQRYAGAPAFKLDKAWTATCLLAGHETISLRNLDADDSKVAASIVLY